VIAGVDENTAHIDDADVFDVSIFCVVNVTIAVGGGGGSMHTLINVPAQNGAGLPSIILLSIAGAASTGGSSPAGGSCIGPVADAEKLQPQKPSAKTYARIAVIYGDAHAGAIT